MRYPGSVAAIGDFAKLVVAHFRQSRLVGCRVVLDGDLRGHAPHRRRPTPMASLDEQQRVSAHERRRHGHSGPVGQAELAVRSEFLDTGKDVVPAPYVESCRMFAEFPQHLVHFERGHHRLDQRGRLDRSLRHTQFILRPLEYVVPKTRLQMRFHLRQVKIGAGATLAQRPCIVEEIQCKIEDGPGNRLAVDQHVLLVEVPASRARNQDRNPVVEPVGPSTLLEPDRAAHCVVQVDLAVDHVGPGRAVGVLEICHERGGSRVERVDDHLPVRRPGDLHPTVQHVGRLRRNAPFRLSDALSFWVKIRQFSGVELGLTRRAPS